MTSFVKIHNSPLGPNYSHRYFPEDIDYAVLFRDTASINNWNIIKIVSAVLDTAFGAWWRAYIFGAGKFILLHVHPLLGNEFANKFKRRQILGKLSVARLRNNRGDYVVRAKQQ
jgi:hypothetical protein